MEGNREIRGKNKKKKRESEQRLPVLLEGGNHYDTVYDKSLDIIIIKKDK